MKKKFFFLVYVKIDQGNIMFSKNNDKSCTMVDLYLNDRFLQLLNKDKKIIIIKDSYIYYDIDIDKILLFKKVITNMLLDIVM